MKFSMVKTFLMLHKQVIAEFLSEEEAACIKEAFDMMDAEKKGKINVGELRIGLKKLGHQIPDADLQILLEAVSSIFPLPPSQKLFYLEIYFRKQPLTVK